MDATESWKEEMRSAYLYRIVAECEAGTAREGLFKQLAKEAESQAGIWSDKLREQGRPAPRSYVPDIRSRIVALLTRHLGPRSTRSLLTAMKVRGMSLYAVSDPRHFVPGAKSGPEGRHRGLSGGGNLRAAVFGVNDGLVSNASLILGVAGAAADANVIVLSGIAGLLAGAFSMAQIVETKGTFVGQGDALTAEAVAAKWDAITDTTVQTHFDSGSGHGGNIFARLQEAAGKA